MPQLSMSDISGTGEVVEDLVMVRLLNLMQILVLDDVGAAVDR